jgi:hypothetical protein
MKIDDQSRAKQRCASDWPDVTGGAAALPPFGEPGTGGEICIPAQPVVYTEFVLMEAVASSAAFVPERADNRVFPDQDFRAAISMWSEAVLSRFPFHC